MMDRYYKDRDFPEVKISNAEIVAVIPDLKQLERVIREHNGLLDQIDERDKTVRLWIQADSQSRAYANNMAREVERLNKALLMILACDFRGNEPQEQRIAREVLEGKP